MIKNKYCKGLFLDINFVCQYNKNMDKLLAVDRVAFTIAGTEIYWYGIIMCLAILTAVMVATMLCKVKKYDTDIPLNVALVVVPVGILSARLFSVLFEKGLNISDYFNFRTGGMSIIGAVVGGAIGLVAYILIKRPKDKWIYFDVLAVVLILAQAIGRWGNFFNGEVYGQMIDSNSAFARFPYAVNIDGKYYQALFLYESVLNLIGFMILTIIFLCSKRRGIPTATYLIYYGAVRTFLETLRQEEYILRLGSLAVSRLFSIAMIVAGIVLLAVILLRSKKREVKHEKK